LSVVLLLFAGRFAAPHASAGACRRRR
jgi:hypothetical protein